MCLYHQHHYLADSADFGGLGGLPLMQVSMSKYTKPINMTLINSPKKDLTNFVVHAIYYFDILICSPICYKGQSYTSYNITHLANWRVAGG